MNKYSFIEFDQLITLWLLYHKIPWAVIIETVNCDYRAAINIFLERAGINSAQIMDKEADCKVLIITGPEAVLRQLVTETELHEDHPDDNLYVDFWHNGQLVLSNWK